VNADFEDAEIVLEGDNDYDLILDATELKQDAIHKASFCEDDYDLPDARAFFEEDLENFLDINIELAERVYH
jgi:hypothetical protein